MTTLFDSVVTKENDHTNLLRNVMERFPKAAAIILSCLLDREVSDADAATFDFETQRVFLGPNGREIPDIVITGNDFRCVVEAKIDPNLGLTLGQQEGYKKSFLNRGEEHLCFLVPADWKHASNVSAVQRSLETTNVAVHHKTWMELIGKLDSAPVFLKDALLNEAINFWKWRFEVKSMSDTEKNLLQDWSGDRYRALRKLQKSIDQAKNRFDAYGFQTQPGISDVEEYGFYIKRGPSYLLWVGIWDKTPVPLAFGFNTRSSGWLRFQSLPPAPLRVDPYDLWPLSPETWDDPTKIFDRVSSFLERYELADGAPATHS